MSGYALATAENISAFFDVRTGFGLSGSSGSGVVLAKLPDGSWGPPSGILVHTIGWGFLIGLDIVSSKTFQFTCNTPIRSHLSRIPSTFPRSTMSSSSSVRQKRCTPSSAPRFRWAVSSAWLPGPSAMEPCLTLVLSGRRAGRTQSPRVLTQAFSSMGRSSSM